MTDLYFYTRPGLKILIYENISHCTSDAAILINEESVLLGS